jgi:hypothetical protein
MDRQQSIPRIALYNVPASGLDCNFNPLAACGRDSLAVENEKGHLDIVPSVIATRAELH